MPVHAVSKGGRVVGFQYGQTGKVYPVSSLGKAGAAKKAGQQAATIEHNSGKK